MMLFYIIGKSQPQVYEILILALCTIVNVQYSLSNIGQKDRKNCISKAFYMYKSKGFYIYQLIINNHNMTQVCLTHKFYLKSSISTWPLSGAHVYE